MTWDIFREKKKKPPSSPDREVGYIYNNTFSFPIHIIKKRKKKERVKFGEAQQAPVCRHQP
jgi:hypothetical protein